MIYLASYKGKRIAGNYSLKAFYNSFQDALIRLLTKAYIVIVRLRYLEQMGSMTATAHLLEMVALGIR